VVIGGGDTAVDVARAAIRLPSVDEVELIFRRPRLDGRSRLEEAAAAQAEGVRLRPLSIPTSIEALDRGLGVVVAEVATYHDVHARYRPRARPGTRCRIDADHVLVAVGRRGPPLPEGGATQQTRDGSQLVVAPTWAAGGDRTGAGTVIRAVADGQALARRVDREITGCEPASSRIRGRVSGPPPHAWPRASQRMAAAAQEGSRCLNCFAAVRSHDEAVCVACGRCVDGCPAGALALGGDDEETVLAREDLCLRCGLCVERCPVGCLLWLEHTDDG
jgi:ferredoxin